MSKLQIFKASAGSGKTFLLTEAYLKLAYNNPDDFSKILAVTFTNKAADEMKSRILASLNALIEKGEEADHYNEICEHLNINSEKFIVKRATEIRDRILHNYSYFQVSTIDSFVQKVIRSFSYEMNLNSSYNIELDTEKVIEELTEILYSRISEDKNLKEWLIQYADFKINEGKNWDFRQEIKSLAYEIFKEKFQSLNTLKNESEDENIKDYLKILDRIKKSFESKMDAISKEYIEVIESKGIDINILGRNFKTISNHFFKKVPAGNYETLPTLLNALDGEENWYAKSADNNIIITIKSVYPDLLKCVSDYFNLLNSAGEDYFTAESIIKNFFSYGIINDIASLLPDYRNENNVLLISDTTYMLKEIIGNNDAPFIYEKIGNKFKNILIDEFQDTSGFQWTNFKPLIENSISQGNTNIIVGDIKQSIYRWRNGDWRLLNKGVKKSLGELFVSEDTIKKNWRSKENIIRFNNTLFHILPGIIQDQFNKHIEAVGNKSLSHELLDEGLDKIITNAYSDQFQQFPENKNITGGKVSMRFYERTRNKEDYRQNISADFPETIENLLKNKNYSPKDIGILVRKNEEAKEVVNMLLTYQSENPENQQYQIISSDSLYIGNSKLVKILISAMKFLSEHSDEINLAQLIFEYQSLITEEELDYTKIFASVKNNSYSDFLPKTFLDTLDDLVQLSVYELSDVFINMFGLNQFENEFPYLRAFQEQISEYSRNRNADLISFLNWWDQIGSTKSILLSDKLDAVSVMTIHKSKGLAFKIVILPFANWSVGYQGVNFNLLWVKPKKKPFDKLKFIPVNYSENLANTIFKKEYFNEKMLSNVDALNMLYVSLTRAKDELHIFTSYGKTPKKELTDIGELLYFSMKSDYQIPEKYQSISLNLEDYYNEPIKKFLIDDNHTNREISETDDSKNLIKNIEEPAFVVNKISDRLQIKYNSEDFFIESIEKVEEKVNYGIMMHEIFSEIHTKKDVKHALDSFIYKGYISDEEFDELYKKILAIIERPEVEYWFSEDFDVKNEEAIISQKGQVKIPDRVLINNEKAIVIDFKFGKKHKKYTDQLIEYKKLIKEVYNLPTEAYIYYVEQNESVQV